MSQLLLQIPRKSTASILKQRSKDEIRLVSPFTVFAKKLNGSLYSWVAYSMGRPRNIVWGTAQLKISEVTVQHGCAWDNLGIINKLIDIRKKDGYVAVSTYAKDMVNERILATIIENAYEHGTALQWGNLYLPYEELSQKVLDILMDHELLSDSRENIMKISRPLALSMLDKPNIAQIMSVVIPREVIDAIHDYVSHNPSLTTNLPETCPLYEDCEEDSGLANCSLYRTDFELL